MKAYIEFEGETSSEDSYHLTQLANLIESDTDLSVQLNTAKPQKGVKVDLVAGLSIASLALSSIGTLITVLSFWKSQQPKYSISVTRGDTKISIDNVKPNQIQSITSQLELEESSSEMRVFISREG